MIPTELIAQARDTRKAAKGVGGEISAHQRHKLHEEKKT